MLQPLLAEVGVGMSGQVAGSAALRRDLIEAVESVRERVTTTTTATVGGLRSAIEASRSESAEGRRSLRQGLLDRVEELHGTNVDRLDELASDQAAARTTAKEQPVAADTGLAEVRDRLSSLVSTELDRVGTSLDGRLDQVGAQVEQLVGRLGGGDSGVPGVSDRLNAPDQVPTDRPSADPDRDGAPGREAETAPEAETTTDPRLRSRQ